MPSLTTLTHDACSAPRRLGPGANAPTRREAGGSHAQTALTDTPAIYTSQGVCDITSIKHACARRRPGSSVVSSQIGAISESQRGHTHGPGSLPLLLPAPPSRASTDTHIPAAALSYLRQAMLVSSRIDDGGASAGGAAPGWREGGQKKRHIHKKWYRWRDR